MKLFRGILMGAALFGSIALVADDIYDDMVDTPEAVKKWSAPGKMEFLPKGGPEGKGAVKMTSDDPAKGVYSEFRMDVAKVQGKKIKVSAMVKGENISKNEKHYLGLKLMFVITGADDKKTYVDTQKFTDTFDWKKIEAAVNVPADAKAATVVIGLQSASGTIYFSDMEVEEKD